MSNSTCVGSGAIVAVLTSAAICSSGSAMYARQEERLPAFEVASVRQVAKPDLSFHWQISERRVDIAGYPLRSIVVEAFRARDYQLAAPEWLDDVFVNIQATLPPGGTVQQVPEMLRSLLIERFALATHSESRQIDAYALKIGVSGLKMREVEALDEIDKRFAPEVNAAGEARSDRIVMTPEGRVRVMAIPRGTRYITSRTMYERTSTDSSTFLIDAIRMTMPELVQLLEPNLDEPLVDRTGLTGVYQFQIELPRNLSTLRIGRSLGLPLSDPKPAGVSALTAVESLGLKLERQPTLMDVVVIDKINRTPTPN